MHFLRYIFVIVFSVIYCEYLGDFFAILPCSWPTLKDSQRLGNENTDLSVMLVADTHLLGPVRGHWLDKLYREWHMKRAFQSAVMVHKPDAVFFLGDLFDEGFIVVHSAFDEYVERFQSLFETPKDTLVISAVGNHDVGFHYRMHSYLVDRFTDKFNNTGVQMYNIKGNHFVFINSMAMEGDSCDFCLKANKELTNLAQQLNCLKNPIYCKDPTTASHHKFYSRPVILQHFPTYHQSSKSCLEHDFPKTETFRENWEVLSKNATKRLGKLLKPRLAFAGHAHHYCHFNNLWGVDEYVVASFSWRNKINPSFLMVSINPYSHAVYKCKMLEQDTVFYIYTIAMGSCSFLFAMELFLKFRKRLLKTKIALKNF